MSGPILLDTGPLVAAIDRRDRYHEWVTRLWGRVAPPLFTCEPVLAEACFLLRRSADGPESVLRLVERGVLRVDFRTADHAGALALLMTKYSDVPMSLADACLVRMAELFERGNVLTLDKDFLVYRRHGRRGIPTIMPE